MICPLSEPILCLMAPLHWIKFEKALDGCDYFLSAPQAAVQVSWYCEVYVSGWRNRGPMLFPFCSDFGLIFPNSITLVSCAGSLASTDVSKGFGFIGMMIPVCLLRDDLSR